MAAFLDSYSAPLAAGLDLRLLGPEAYPGSGISEALRGLRESVLAAGWELERRDEEVLAQERAARTVRRRRMKALGRVRWLLVRYRKTLKAAYDPLAVEAHLGMQGATSEDPVVLLRQARRAEALLTVAELPQRDVAIFEIDPAQYAARLGWEADALERAIAAAVYARRAEKAAILARKQAARAFDELFRPACRWLASLCELAGMAEHASLIPVAGKGLARLRPRQAAVSARPLPSTSPPLSLPISPSPLLLPRSGPVDEARLP